MFKRVFAIADEEFLKKLETVKSEFSTKNFVETAKMHSYIAYGETIKKLNLKTKHTLQDNLQYRLLIFRNKQELIEYQHNGPTNAVKFINKHIVPNHPIEPYYQGEDDEELRPLDFGILHKFEVGKIYEGTWIDIDMHSAEPYFVGQVCPEAKEAIHKLFLRRKKEPWVKHMLNCINGNLRNSHISIYTEVVTRLFLKIWEVISILENCGAECAYIRRDGVIARVPDDFIIPNEIDVGDDIGQFSVKWGKGRIFTTSNLNFESDMQEIEGKHQGEETPSLLQNIQMVGDYETGEVLRILKGEENEKVD